MNQLLMIDDKGGNVLVLVLGPANVNLMREGRPVSKRIEEFYPDGIHRKLEMLIYYSETPVATMIEPRMPPPGQRPSIPNTQPPTMPPRMPRTMSMTTPYPPPLITFPASQPAINPTTIQ